MISRSVKRLETLYLKLWWVALFLLFCYTLYEQGLKKRNDQYATLHNQESELILQKELATALHEKLLLQVNSQSDPAWVELVLMKGLGLVPESQTKVFFTRQE